MTRKEKKTFADDRTAAFFVIDTELEVWGTNSGLSDKKVTLEVTSFDLHSDWTNQWSKEVVLAQNASTELYEGELPGQPRRHTGSDIPKAIIVSSRLLDKTGVVLGRHCNWYDPGLFYAPILSTPTCRPEPFKYIRFPCSSDVGLKVIVCADGNSVLLSTNKPIKGLILDVDGQDVRWSDQALDLVPGDPQTVKAEGLNGREVQVRYLGDGTT